MHVLDSLENAGEQRRQGADRQASGSAIQPPWASTAAAPAGWPADDQSLEGLLAQIDGE